MERGQGGRRDFFGSGDPFTGFGGHRSLMSSFLGGRDPFDDPFFTRPFGSMFGPSLFDHNMFGSGGHQYEDSPASGFLEHESAQKASKSEGLVIQELSSDDDEEQIDNKNEKDSASKEPLVEDPDDEMDERSEGRQVGNEYKMGGRVQPQAPKFSFQSATVSYGGVNGAYYTSSKSRRMGGDGVVVEESREADTTTGKATHRISKGIHDKGHSVTRKLNSDGRIETVKTLHNLNEDDLGSFEAAWEGNAKKHLPVWDQGFNMNGYPGASVSGLQGQGSRELAFPHLNLPQRPNMVTRNGDMGDNSFHWRNQDFVSGGGRKSPSVRRVPIE